MVVPMAFVIIHTTYVLVHSEPRVSHYDQRIIFSHRFPILSGRWYIGLSTCKMPILQFNP